LFAINGDGIAISAVANFSNEGSTLGLPGNEEPKQHLTAPRIIDPTPPVSTPLSPIQTELFEMIVFFPKLEIVDDVGHQIRSCVRSERLSRYHVVRLRQKQQLVDPVYNGIGLFPTGQRTSPSQAAPRSDPHH
jgi:hypothetical protein